jgi:hypothetical protein
MQWHPYGKDRDGDTRCRPINLLCPLLNLPASDARFYEYHQREVYHDVPPAEKGMMAFWFASAFGHQLKF